MYYSLFQVLQCRSVAVSELPGYSGRRHAWRTRSKLMGGEKSGPSPNRQGLDWSVVLTIGRLCPIVPQVNIVASNKHN